MHKLGLFGSLLCGYEQGSFRSKYVSTSYHCSSLNYMHFNSMSLIQSFQVDGTVKGFHLAIMYSS